MPNKTNGFLSLQYTSQESISDLSQCFVFFRFWVLCGSERPGRELTRVFFSVFTHERSILSAHTYTSLICKFLEFTGISAVSSKLWFSWISFSENSILFFLPPNLPIRTAHFFAVGKDFKLLSLRFGTLSQQQRLQHLKLSFVVNIFKK